MPLLESKDISVVTKANYEHMVLITSLELPIMAIAQLYRDRADVEPERSGDSQPQAARRANAVRQCLSYFRDGPVILRRRIVL